MAVVARETHTERHTERDTQTQHTYLTQHVTRALALLLPSLPASAGRHSGEPDDQSTQKSSQRLMKNLQSQHKAALRCDWDELIERSRVPRGIDAHRRHRQGAPGQRARAANPTTIHSRSLDYARVAEAARQYTQLAGRRVVALFPSKRLTETGGTHAAGRQPA